MDSKQNHITKASQSFHPIQIDKITHCLLCFQVEIPVLWSEYDSMHKILPQADSEFSGECKCWRKVTSSTNVCCIITTRQFGGWEINILNFCDDQINTLIMRYAELRLILCFLGIYLFLRIKFEKLQNSDKC